MVQTREDRRLIALDGGRNFRDLGGYEASDGRTICWGRLFRSGSIGHLTDGDWAALNNMGVRSFCDLRTTREREAEPFRWASEDGIRYYSRDYETSFAKLRELMRQPFASEADAAAAMIAGYRGLAFDQADAYRTMFGYLLAGGAPLVVNCSAGKDRAGLAAALLLSALDVPRDTIIADFVLTDRYGQLEARMGQSGSGSTLGAQPVEVRRAILSARPDYLAAAFEAIEDRHGSVLGYLDAELSVGAKDIERLRNDLLE